MGVRLEWSPIGTTMGKNYESDRERVEISDRKKIECKDGLFIIFSSFNLAFGGFWQPKRSSGENSYFFPPGDVPEGTPSRGPGSIQAVLWAANDPKISNCFSREFTKSGLGYTIESEFISIRQKDMETVECYPGAEQRRLPARWFNILKFGIERSLSRNPALPEY